MPYDHVVTPWHAAMAAVYAHATASLCRLADRYVVLAALVVTNGCPVPDAVSAAFDKLPPVMARADALQGQIDWTVLDLAEAVMLAEDVGRTFQAVVVNADRHPAGIQLRDLPILARMAAHDVARKISSPSG